MIIVKIGGGASINLEGVIADLAEIETPFLIVHGANALRDHIAERLGSPKKVITSASGYSSVLSDETALDNIMMAYSGLRNKRIVELCHRHGVNAVGLSGLDGKLVRGERNKGIRVKEGGKMRIVRDFSGKPKTINVHLLNLLLDNGYVPVITVPIIDENNFAINTENDDVINVIQQEMQADMILQLIEAPGFLDDPQNPNSLVEKMTKLDLAAREEQVEGRMKRKMLALRKLFESGAQTVVISDGRTEHPVKDALSGKGTRIS